MKSIGWWLYVGVYAMLLAMVSTTVQWEMQSMVVYGANVVLLVISTVVTYRVVKFFVELVENLAFSEETLYMSTIFDKVFAMSLAIRGIIIWWIMMLKVQGAFTSVAILYVMLTLGALLVIYYWHYRQLRVKVLLGSAVPFVIYLVLDVWTFTLQWR